MKRHLCFALLFFTLSGVASTHKQGHYGIATWYGKKDHGRKTSSGRRFDEHELTAASHTLPFGTILRVTYLKTGRSVDVVITDREPYHSSGRILDLSEAAAKEIGLRSAGVGRVKLEIINEH